MREYIVEEGSHHDGFQKSRAKVQIMGGGYGNGKTTALVIKALVIAEAYPGINMLLGRSTYPKLNDTLRKEFLIWCPKHWIESGPSNTDNTVYLKNGSIINFRYIAQQGKTKESTTSNLLSANYGFVGIDQLEDPEITEKDFKDLMGRLRGNAKYVGNDPTMPKSGPRWFVGTTNPTANWVYKSLVRPLHRFRETNYRDPKLIVHPKSLEPWIDVFEASTYENARNVPPDFIEGLEATYTGQMRDRFLLGKWASFEGLVHPLWDEVQHYIPYSDMRALFRELRKDYDLEILEAYDFGIAVPSCYLFAFVDPWANVHLLDGFYEVTGGDIKKEASLIRDIRDEYGVASDFIQADPSIFRRGPSSEGARGLGPSVASMFEEHGIDMTRGNAAVLNGIVKVNAYLTPAKMHDSPYSGVAPSPHLFVSNKVNFVADEITEYYWKKSTDGTQYEDQPQDRNDHSMNALKYLLSEIPEIPKLTKEARTRVPGYMRWGERELPERFQRNARHRSR